MEIFQHSRKGAARVINEDCILTKNTAKSKREGDVSGMPSSEIRRQGERFFSLAKYAPTQNDHRQVAQNDHRQVAHIIVQMILTPSRCFSQILLRRDAEVDIQMIICIYHDLVNQHGNDGALGFP